MLVSIEARVDLLVAALNLKEVQLVRAAIRTADLSAGGVPGPLGTIEQPETLARRHITPEPRIEPRVVYHPTPRFEPRPVIHPAPRFLPRPVIEESSCPPMQPEQPPRSHNPIQPPWRVLPWQIPSPPPPKVKVVLIRPDIVSKGSLIDFFI
jgi:hypothetical protein